MAGAKRVVLDVFVDNASARRLYEACGYRTVAGERVLRMEAVPGERESWQGWDKPGVADTIEAYWRESQAERAHRVWIAKVVSDSARTGTLAEAGCGSGHIYELVRGLPQVTAYEGFDTSLSMLSLARAAHPGARWSRMDLRDLPSEVADTVICIHVLGHVPGDLVAELRSLICAAKDTAIVSLWVGAHPSASFETLNDVSFHRIVRTHTGVLQAIAQADPDCSVVDVQTDGPTACYVIRRRLVHSVILGSYNRPTYVRKAIRSVLDQAYPHWQLIITDDASNDETVAAIKAEIGNDERCQLIRATDAQSDGPRPTGNVRAVERINDAIPLVRGDIVHYLPDDDWFMPGRFEAFNEAFKRPGVKMAYGVMRYADGEVISTTDGIYPGGPVNDPWCVLDQTQVAHRASCFRKVPRWPTRDIAYAADGVFYRTLCHAGYGPVHPFEKLVSVHRRHGLNLLSVQTGATNRRE